LTANQTANFVQVSMRECPLSDDFSDPTRDPKKWNLLSTLAQPPALSIRSHGDQGYR